MEYDLDINKILLIGTMTKPPDLRRTQKGTALLKIQVVVNKTYMGRDGTPQEGRSTHSVTVWGRRGEELAGVVDQGSRILVEGELKNRKVENRQTGESTWITEIHAHNVVPLDRHPPNQYQQPQYQQPAQQGYQAPPPAQGRREPPPEPPTKPDGTPLVPEDDLPF